jgi:8-oxo-dGTP pyrophosphatase MutT (NUDIX family)
MHQQSLLQLLAAHVPYDATEAEMLARTQEFVAAHTDCFLRCQLSGHVTGSAWVTDATGSNVLLLHHRKLERWLQPGGHCDGDADVARVALREATEESGITTLEFVSARVFDVDVHWIPERGDVPGHWHYDIRFHLCALSNAALRPNHESNEARWVPLSEIMGFEEASLRRMAEKSPRRK